MNKFPLSILFPLFLGTVTAGEMNSLVSKIPSQAKWEIRRIQQADGNQAGEEISSVLFERFGEIQRIHWKTSEGRTETFWVIGRVIFDAKEPGAGTPVSHGAGTEFFNFGKAFFGTEWVRASDFIADEVVAGNETMRFERTVELPLPAEVREEGAGSPSERVHLVAWIHKQTRLPVKVRTPAGEFQYIFFEAPKSLQAPPELVRIARERMERAARRLREAAIR